MSASETKLQKNAGLGQASQEAANQFETEESYVRMVVRRFMKHRLAVAGLIVMVILMLAAIFAPWLAPHNPYAVTDLFGAPPSSKYWLGTDQTARDVLSRLIYGARISISVGVGSVLIGVVVGTILGLVSGYFGGWIDMLVMRITDIFMSFPNLMLILVILSVVGSSLAKMILILGLLGWTGVARLVRGNVLSLRQSDFVKASKALGLSTPRILFLHILPNTVAPILVNTTFGIAGNILIEAALSFLGLGVQPPTASWGNMLTDAQSLTVLVSQFWLWVPPGMMIILTVLSINFVGDGLRDAFDPKSLN